MNLYEFLDEIEKLVDENPKKDWTKVKLVVWNDCEHELEEIETLTLVEDDDTYTMVVN